MSTIASDRILGLKDEERFVREELRERQASNSKPPIAEPDPRDHV